MSYLDKRILNFLVIIILTLITFWWTFNIFHLDFDLKLVLTIICIRIFSSILIFKDYSLSWSKSSQKTFLIKSIVYIVGFLIYTPFYYGYISISFLVSELFLYIFSINFIMYLYYYLVNKSKITKTKQVVIYGAGKAGIRLEEEFKNSEYKVKYFVDDDRILHKRSIDSIPILSKTLLEEKIDIKNKFDLLVIAIPSAPKNRVSEIYENLIPYFKEIRILPSLDEILESKNFSMQLKDITVEDLLARHPKDLDKNKISKFLPKILVVTNGIDDFFPPRARLDLTTFTHHFRKVNKSSK